MRFSRALWCLRLLCALSLGILLGGASCSGVTAATTPTVPAPVARATVLLYRAGVVRTADGAGLVDSLWRVLEAAPYRGPLQLLVTPTLVSQMQESGAVEVLLPSPRTLTLTDGPSLSVQRLLVQWPALAPPRASVGVTLYWGLSTYEPGPHTVWFSPDAILQWSALFPTMP